MGYCEAGYFAGYCGYGGEIVSKFWGGFLVLFGLASLYTKLFLGVSLAVLLFP